jgi:hypothetical protein
MTSKVEVFQRFGLVYEAIKRFSSVFSHKSVGIFPLWKKHATPPYFSFNTERESPGCSPTASFISVKENINLIDPSSAVEDFQLFDSKGSSKDSDYRSLPILDES